MMHPSKMSRISEKFMGAFENTMNHILRTAENLPPDKKRLLENSLIVTKWS